MSQTGGQIDQQQMNKAVQNSKEKQQQPNWLRRQYVLARQFVLGRTSGKVHRLLEQEFNPIFTWSLVAVLQMAYLGWLLSRGSLNQANVLVRFGAQLHIVLLLVGGAALRCFLAWLVYAQDDGSVSGEVAPGTLFDYPQWSKTSLLLEKKASVAREDKPAASASNEKQKQPTSSSEKALKKEQ